MNRSRSLLLIFGSSICFLLIVVVTYQMLTGSDRSMTFKGFLDWLSSFHPLISDVSYVDSTIVDSWGLFDGFRTFINVFISIFDFALYCIKSAINLISYITGSVIYVQEASLVADSQLIRDMTINERLLLFNKLIGHETKGGCLIYDTQCIGDVHYSIKRCLSEYFYIHHLIKWIPFVLIAYVEENRYSDDGHVITSENDDVEKNLRKVFISKRTWKYFDCYCYSVLTDDLPVESNVVNNDVRVKDLKARKILSFRKGGFNEKKAFCLWFCYLCSRG